MRRAVAGVTCALLLLSLLVGAAVTATVVAPSTAEAATTSTPLTVPEPRDVIVEPATGRVFVSGGDAIDVFAPDGTRTTTISGVPGAGGLDIAGGSLWATTSVKELVEIDLATLTVVRSLPVTLTLNPGLVVVGSKAFARVDNPFIPGSDAVLGIDLVTGATKGMAGSATVELHRAEGVTDRVFVVARQHSNPTTIRVISTTAPYPVLNQWTTAPIDASGVSPDGLRLWAVSDWGASTDGIRELDVATGQEVGVRYVSTNYIEEIAHTSARGGLLAGMSDYEVSLNQVGAARRVGTLDLATDRDSMVAFSPDGFVLWRVTAGALEGTTLVPSMTSIAPTSAPATRGDRIEIEGSLLEGAAVSVGGTPATVTSSNVRKLAFTVPVSVPPGVHEVLLAHPFGDLRTSVTVTDPVGALNGSVRVAGSGREGVVLRLDGDGLPAPLTATTRTGGFFTFDAVPAVAPLRLEVEQLSGSGAGQVVENIELVPNRSTNIDIELRAASHAPAPSTMTELPGSQADGFSRFRDEATSGRTFVHKGAELLALDGDGDLVGRVRGFGVPHGITTGAGSVFVASAASSGSGSLVTRVDPASFAITGEWPVDTIATGAIAHAGGRLFVVVGGTVRALDLATGTLSPIVAPAGAAGLATVDGDPDLLLVSTGSGVSLLDVGAPAPVTVAVLVGDGSAVAADGPTDRLWTSTGREYELSTLTPTGRDFGVQGVPTHAVGSGGVVAFGPTVVSLSTSGIAHSLGTSPISGLPSSGDVAYAPSSSGDLAVFDLTPHLTAAGPAYEGGSFTVAGWGLLPTVAAEIDGVPVAFDVRSATQVEVRASVAVGTHEVRLHTPWGASDAVPVVVQDRPGPSTVTGVAPATVPITGGSVTITGTGFTWASSIDVGGVTVTSFTVVDDTTIRFVAPPHQPGPAPIRVDSGAATGTPGASLSYVPTGAAPSVTSLSPSSGSTLGGTSVMINGINLSSPIFVTFDGVPATTVTPVGPTQVRATSPAHAAGPVAVHVTTAGGRSLFSTSSTFLYRVPAPSTTAVSPDTGSTTGGTSVTLSGTWFTGATAVRFGGVPATTFTVVDDHTIVAVAPPRPTPDVVNVLVTTPAGTDVATTANRFAYTVPPVGSISGVVRDTAGPLSGMVVLVSPAATPSLLTAVPTGADGSFSVPSLVPGAYKVYVFDGRLIYGVPAQRVGEWYQAGASGTADFGASTAVSVVAGGDVALEPIVLAATAPGSIAGVVTDGTAPLAGIVVLVSPVSQPQASAYAVTGADGRFSVGGLAPGSYKVVAMDGAAIYGLPATFVTEYYDDVPDSPTAFAAAPAVAVAASTATSLAPIVLARR